MLGLPRLPVPTYRYPSTTGHNLVCLVCASRSRRRKRRLSQVAGIALSLAITTWASVSVYKMEIVTFTEVAHATRKAVDIMLRIDRDIVATREALEGVKARLVRSEANTARLLERQKSMEAALHVCSTRWVKSPAPQRPTEPDPMPSGNFFNEVFGR